MKDLNDFLKYLECNRNYSKYTIKNYELDIKNFIEFCKKENIDLYKIKYNDVKKYMVKLYDLKYKATSLSRHISALRTFYSYLYDESLVDKNIFKYINLPKKEKKLPKYITSNDIDIIFDIPDDTSPFGQRNKLILELLYTTGIRVSELCNIKLDDIDFNKKEIRIFGKGSKERIVLYNNECSDILDLYLNDGRNVILNGKINTYLIVGKSSTKRFNERSVELIIEDLINKSALSLNITPHVFRHTFATHLLNEGCDILIVKELLGHSSLDTTGIYTHVSNERLRNVYLKSHPRAKK